MPLLELLSFIALLFWLVLSLDRGRAWPHELRLDTTGQPAAPHRVVAIVPARNEAMVLPESLPTLLRQDHPGFRIVMVDDGSTDDTATVASRLAAKTGLAERLEIVSAPAVPEGWSGKVHALARGLVAIDQAPDQSPDWLLLSDADIAHRPGSVAALLSRATDGTERYDLVSVMARLNAEGFWARLLIPPFVFFFQLLYPFRLVRSPRSSIAAAAGGCVLVRLSTLRAAGGFDALKTAVIDDVALARAIQGAGGRLWLGLDPGIRSVRSYRGLGEIWDMVARTAFVQLRHSSLLLALTLAGLALLVVGPLVQALTAAVSGAGSAALMALAAWALSARALWPSVRHHRVPWPYAFSLPLAALFYGGMTASSAWRDWRGRGATWKGRSYGGRRFESERES